MNARGAMLSPSTPTLGMKGANAVSTCCLSVLLVGALGIPQAFGQSLEEADRALSNLESDTQRLMASPVPAHRLKSDTFVEERLTDGELYLRLGDYLRAAILLTDIVDHYPNHRAYPEALFLLGESLFSAGDYLGARKRYGQVIERSADQAFSGYLQDSLSRLIEIAIHTRDFRDIDKYFVRLEALPSSELSVTTRYFRAKYLYNRAVPVNEVLAAPLDAPLPQIDEALLEKARLGFLSVPSGTAFSLRAGYFVGTIHTLRQEYLDAIAAFRAVLGQEPASEEEQEVIGLSYLALGRLYYETDQLAQAVEAYRALDQSSPSYDDALYELAWTYIRMGDAVLAERALEVLSVAAPQSPLNADGQVLRGELLARAGRFAEAGVVFEQARDTFLPIRNDLVRLRNEHPDLHAYFRQVVRQNLYEFDMNDFLPESAQRWIDLEGDHQRALEVLADLAQSRQLVVETRELAERITAVLSAPNRVSVFSDLRRQRERTTALRNRAAQLRAAWIEREARALGPGGGEIARVRDRRRELQAAVMTMPTETENFIDRDMDRLEEYRTAERKLQALRVEILGLEARIVASQTGLASVDPSKVDRNEIRAKLASHQQEVRAYEDRLVEIRRALEVGRLHVGVGDKRYQTDDRERSNFLDLVNRERQLAGSAGPAYDGAQRRLAAVERLLDQRDAELQAVVRRRATEMLSTVQEETANLQRYSRALDGLEEETVDVVGAIAFLNFNRIYDRFYELVLRADLGKVDLAWAEREKHRVRVDELTRERARELQALDEEFRDVMDQGRSPEGGP